MSSSTALPHRVSTIRTQTSSSSLAGGAPTPTTPYTPTRTGGGLSYAVPGSPSSARAEEDIIVIEVGSRGVRVGMAGDAIPKAILRSTPALERRVGDWRTWEPGWVDNWRQSGVVGEEWSKRHELWGNDVRGLDLGLVEDKLDRLLRDAFTRYLLLDSKPRKICLVLQSSVAIPLLSSLLNTLFHKFQPPLVSLLSSAAMTAVGAGVRSALVVDLGWSETVITSVYEYREVRTSRSIRATKMLLEATHDVLREVLETPSTEGVNKHHVSFDECDEVCSRLMWCRPMPGRVREGPGLSSARGQGETEAISAQSQTQQPAQAQAQAGIIRVPLKSIDQPTIVSLPMESLADACERTFVAPGTNHAQFDDHELPIHLLIYNHLLQLPVDVRAICMSRIIFTGGSANVLGLRERISDELSSLAQKREWSLIVGRKFINIAEANGKKQPTIPTTPATTAARSRGEDYQQVPGTHGNGDRGGGGGGGGGGGAGAGQRGVRVGNDGVWHDAANVSPENDPVEEQIRKGRREQPPVHGQIRAIESIGAWGGASLVANMRVAAMATIDRDVWLQQGATGASKPSEVDVKMQQRHSMGAGGIMKGSQAQNWTLGVWGAT